MRNLKFNCFIDNRRGLSLKKNFPYLAIVGEIGSGKSQVCSLLVEQYEYTRIPCSQILRELMSSKAKTRDDRHKLQDAGYKYINKRGAHKRFARKIVEYIKSKAANKTILIDGLRYKETFLEIQKELGVNKIPLIYVQSNREDQYRNFISREKSEATVVDFMEIIEHPVESFVGQFLEYTDIFIYNFGSLDSLTKEVGDYLQKEPTSAFLIDAWDNNAAYRHNQILRGADLTFDNLVTPYFINSLKKHKDYPNLRVLDIGCGTGILTNLIAEHAKHITAIDHSSASIQVAKQHTVKKNINFQSENAERFVVENSFDVVIANMSLHSIEGLELTLKNIYSSLKSNGALIFSLPHPRYYPERERLRDVFKLSGFDYTKPSFHKIPFTISLEPEPLPSLIPYFHRPVSYYENIISKTGFWIIETFAPMPDEALMRKYRKSWQTPHVLLGFAIKPQSN